MVALVWLLPTLALAAGQHVAVHLAGTPADRALVESVIRERLEGLELDLAFDAAEAIDSDDVLVPRGVSAADLARIWIDTVPAEQCTLYVSDGPWERILVRRFERHANFEITAEELGHAVFSTVQALRAGERIGVTRADLAPAGPRAPEPPPVRAPKPVPLPARVRPWRLHGGVLFEANAYGNGPELASGPGAIVQLEHRQGHRVLGGALTGQLRLPSTVSRGPATVDLDGGTFRVVGLAGLRMREHWQLVGLAGFGLDVLDATTRSTVGVTGTKVETVAPMVRAGVMGLVHTKYLRVFAMVGLDVQAGRTRYLIARTDGTSTLLFSPWPVQPFVAVGLQTP